MRHWRGLLLGVLRVWGSVRLGVPLILFGAMLGSVSWGEGQVARRGAQVGEHWHAPYQIVFCAWVLGPLPATPGNIHTHGDGVIHIHPQSPAEAGSHATLGAFFRAAGARLTRSSLELPGWLPMRNGDQCPDHRPGRWRLLVNGRVELAMDAYILQDGDEIRLEFQPE